MGRSLIIFLSSYKATIVMLLLYAAGLAIATFVEKYAGAEMAKITIYYSPLFFLLQALLVANFVLITIIKRYIQQKKWAYLTLHFGFVIILAGALTSHIFSKEGVIHLREGETTSQMQILTNRGEFFHDLPFSLELEKFMIHYYPGSDSPSSFESRVKVSDKNGKTFERLISMNNVLDIHAYRIFQSSYDSDGLGTILSVNKDLMGTSITYAGYAFLLLGFLLMFFTKNSRFSYLIRQLRRSKIAAVVVLSLFSGSAFSQEINPEHAARFGALPMQSFRGRIEPVNSFASEVVRKLHHSNRFENLNPDQFLLSLLAYPEEYSEQPVLYLKNNDVAFHYDLPEGYCSFYDLFDSNGNYKLVRDVSDIFAQSPSKRNRFEKDVLKLDEQANVFFQLINHGMIRLFPDREDADQSWYAPGDDLTSLDSLKQETITKLFDIYIFSVRNAVDTNDWELADKALLAIYAFQEKEAPSEIDQSKIKTELLYNKWDVFRHCKKAYLIFGGLLLVFSFLSLFKSFRYKKLLEIFLSVCIILGFLFHLGGMILRGSISGYVPWSNAYETMVLVSFLTVLVGIVFARKSMLTFALATLFGGIILFVSGLNWMDPQISPLVPVLKSPWLMIHVAVIVGAYGFFGISFLLGGVNLLINGIQNNVGKHDSLLRLRLDELTIINEISMMCGLVLMTIGTFVGAIWANESWGRYWGWDPKETWALITIIIYAVVLHLRLVKKWDNPTKLNLYAILAFLCVLMTFFGVNYFLSGMHSYA